MSWGKLADLFGLLFVLTVVLLYYHWRELKYQKYLSILPGNLFSRHRVNANFAEMILAMKRRSAELNRLLEREHYLRSTGSSPGELDELDQVVQKLDQGLLEFWRAYDLMAKYAKGHNLAVRPAEDFLPDSWKRGQNVSVREVVHRPSPLPLQ